MKLTAVMLAGLLTAGCSIKAEVVDSRLTREEVIQAFRQRDQAIEILAGFVKEYQNQYPLKEKKK